MLTIDLTTRIVDAGCLGQSKGSISVAASGGTGPYTYLWSNGATTSEITGLSPGLYWVKATDSLGDTGSASYFVNASTFVIDFTFQYPTPGNSDGSLTVKTGVSGAAGVYTYLWSNGATTKGINNIGSGLYTVAVTNPYGCIQIATILLVDEDQGTLAMLNCCAGDLAYIYVWARKNGLTDFAELTAGKLTLLQGFIKDVCEFDGNCITEDQKNSIIEKAKEICGCCCGQDISNDSLKA